MAKLPSYKVPYAAQPFGQGVGIGNYAYINKYPPVRFSLFGWGGLAVRRDIHSTRQGPGINPGQSLVPVGISGTSGGLYQAGQLVATALSNFQQLQPNNGQSQ